MTTDPIKPLPPFAAKSAARSTKQVGFALVVECLRNLVVDNPILNESTRAVRRIFRTGKTAQILALVIFCLFYGWMNIESFLAQSDASVPFSYIELVLLTLIIPGSIYNAISGEREHATWDALILTRLTAGQIVFGKLVWRLRAVLVISFFCLVTICVSRINTTYFNHTTNFSSTTNSMVVMSQFMLISWAMLLSTFGLWVSAITKRSITSLAVIALVVIGFLVALPTLYGLLASAIGGSGAQDDPVTATMLALNPFYTLPAVLGSNGSDIYLSVWPSAGKGLLQIEFYLGLSILFIAGTYYRLRVLELPHRGRR